MALAADEVVNLAFLVRPLGGGLEFLQQCLRVVILAPGRQADKGKHNRFSGGARFPFLWSVIGAALFVAIVVLLSGGRRV